MKIQEIIVRLEKIYPDCKFSSGRRSLINWHCGRPMVKLRVKNRLPAALLTSRLLAPHATHPANKLYFVCLRCDHLTIQSYLEKS